MAKQKNNLKGIVAKIDKENKTMLLLTKDKQFRRVPLPADIPDLGSETEITLPPEREKTAGGFPRASWLAAAAALLLVLGISLFGNFSPAPVSASSYVTLDMVPSLRLAVDARGKVVSATAFNDAGSRLISDLDVENKNVYLAVQDAVKKAKNAGYFKNDADNLVMVAISEINDTAAYQIEKEKLRLLIQDEMSAGHHPGYVVVNKTGKEEWQNAQKMGCSVNKIIVQERMRKRGIEVDQGNLNAQEIPQVIDNSQTPVPTLFSGNCHRVTMPEGKGHKHRHR